MAAVVIAAALGVLMLVLGIVLMMGRGSCLIAGYNTAPEAVKKLYDEKKLCRSSGVVVLIASVLLFTIAFLGYWVETGQMEEADMLEPVAWICAVLAAAVAASMIYGKKCCRIK